MNQRDEHIRAKAHELWLAEGQPSGRELDHWLKAAEQVEAGHVDKEGADVPGAGPHARPDLTNADATPGTGMLPDIGSDDPNQQPSG